MGVSLWMLFDETGPMMRDGVWAGIKDMPGVPAVGASPFTDDPRRAIRAELLEVDTRHIVQEWPLWTACVKMSKELGHHIVTEKIPGGFVGVRLPWANRWPDDPDTLCDR